MTITLKPETEAKLREKAEREGQDANELADALLAAALEWAAREYQEIVTAIQEGMDAAAEGREKHLEQYIAEQTAKRGLPESWPSRTSVTEIVSGITVPSD